MISGFWSGTKLPPLPNPVMFPWPNPNNEEIKRLQSKLDAIHAIYKRRCKATIDNFTEGEEMFLSDLSMILSDEQVGGRGAMTAKKCTDQQICDLADRGVSISEMRRILHADTPRIKQVAPDAGRHPVPAETIEPYIREGYAHTQIAKILHVAPTSIKKLFPETQWTKADAGRLGLMSRKLEEI